jgi:predicted phosphoribosyltransferase
MFTDRADAGRQLGTLVRAALADIVDGPAPIVVVGLPRGGVPVAVEVARALTAPCDVIVVRKVGVPGHRELAMGAIGEGGVTVRNDDVIRSQRVTPEQFADVEREERAELLRRSHALRSDRPSPPLDGHVAVVVDDGLATGATARAACEVARAAGAAVVVLAVPVAPEGFDRDLGATADRYVAVETPRYFRAVGEHYRDFAPVGDRDVVAMLDRMWRDAPGNREPDQGDR